MVTLHLADASYSEIFRSGARMSEFDDRPKKIRPGEELDVKKLGAYLRDQLNLTGELSVEQFPSGFSNLTYMLKLGEREMVLRRPPFGANIKSAHDMNREYTILSMLNPIYAKAPKPLIYSDDQQIIGAEFYVMERVRGVILRPTMPKAMHPKPELMRQVSESLVDALVELHAIDLDAAGLATFGKPEGYVNRQIAGWTRRWQKSMTDQVPAMDEAAAWLAQNQPPETGATLIHNDFKYDNFVLDSADWRNIIAVLDWEMATVGDPLMDLGTSLSYWVEAADPAIIRLLNLSPTTLPGNLSRHEFVDRYAEKSGRNVENITFYYAYGAFKLGVIVQQIYQRWKLGHTQDPRFAGLLEAVKACGLIATQAIESGKI
jgi:aminoglycoside phosphotransferase (APT) family kinase protein